MFEYSFEKLRVWQKARTFVKDIYLITKKFPESEKYGLKSQIQRSAISVSSNIVEGSTRLSRKDQAYFMQLAYSSLMECLSQLILANDLGYLDDSNLQGLRQKTEELSNLLNSFRKSLLNPDNT
jgi:four helix bundle protein